MDTVHLLFYELRFMEFINRLGENLNDFFTTIATSTTTITTLPPVIISSINNPFGVNWGDWGPAEECDQSDFVIGFRTKLHPKQSSGIDDTALNGVELICSNGKHLHSSDGQYVLMVQSLNHLKGLRAHR
ncbi:unnamed protein product [Brachionus calyciflorus]|uniref:Uncharacterized protein n=1 Tax=Brachionus calyciflorus TaxID=104777 RepID=A0A813TSS9_9BILA|nr:unnamed protein product [Brachionus calyciflorus]